MRQSRALDHGHVLMEDHMGSDLAIVNNARVSFNVSSDEMSNSEVGLINFLMKNRHGSPFEAVVLKFDVKCPVFVAREWFRHRIGSFNEVSARYSRIETEGYIPERDNIRHQVGKPGAYTFERVEDDGFAYATTRAINDVYNHSFATYDLLVQRGVAKEIARLVLPMGFYTRFKWVVNLRSLLNFLSLRNSSHAQYEIREYAKIIEDIVSEVIPVAMQAFVDNGRICP